MTMNRRSITLVLVSLAWLPINLLGSLVSAAEVSAEDIPKGLEKSDWHSIRAAHEAWQHEFREVDGKWQARNPGQRWNTTFNGRNFTTNPDAGEWTWGLQLQSYGFSQNLQTISGTPIIKACGQRLSYIWESGLDEWFVNDQRGLEHGYIVPERPEGATPGEPLTFTISTLGTLRPSVSKDAQTIHFRGKGGAPILNYSGLKVWDADGMILGSRFEKAAEGDFRIVVDEGTARYPITIDPIAQQAFLKASNTDAFDFFGRSVSVSDDTVVIGAYQESSSATGVDGNQADNSAPASGAAYVFVRSGSSWSQQAYLKASNTDASDLFGRSVSISGDTVVVGAPEESSSASGVGANQTDNNANSSGAAYVFIRSGTTWSQQAYLKASNSDAGDFFGYSVSVAGDAIIVGATRERSNSTGVNGNQTDNSLTSPGAAYVFARSGVSWSQQAYLKASNTNARDIFGWSVSISGDTAVVGAYLEDSSLTGVNGGNQADNGAQDSGAAYVFRAPARLGLNRHT